MPPTPKPPKPTPRHLFVTGQPGCGKTTLVARVCERLRALQVELQGFYTEEVRKGGARVGFDVITLDGQRGPLSRVGKATGGQPTVGSYVVDVPSFEFLALPSLAPPSEADSSKKPAATTATTTTTTTSGRKRPRSSAEEETATANQAASKGTTTSSSSADGRLRVVVIDEVGKMELALARFQARVGELLDRPDVLVLGSVPMPRYGREIEFVGQIKARPDVKLVKVLKGTREEGYQEALNHVMTALGLAPASSSS